MLSFADRRNRPGFDSGYIGGVLGMRSFQKQFGRPVPVSDAAPGGFNITTGQKSLITSILSAGTFFGALFAGSLADWIGRRLTIISACLVFIVGVIIQITATSVGGLVAGRTVAGFGVGIVSTTVILYMSEIAPRKIRGALVAGYQFAITIGLFLASIVDNATKDRAGASAYRIPIGIQFAWAVILAVGLFFLPESPRYFVKKGQNEKATQSLMRIRAQPADSEFVQAELAEIVANYEYEMSIQKASWADCFKGGLHPRGNLYRVIVGTALQMFQQLTGVNFIFYYGTTFFQNSGIKNAFTVSVATSVVNVGSTPISWWAIERLGRRKLLIMGAAAMLVFQFIIAAVGTALPHSKAASTVLIVFVCLYIASFASTWGPAAWVVVGEIFPLPIRSKGVALSTASNWLWNFILGYVTPYMVDSDEGNLGAKVFFVWLVSFIMHLLTAMLTCPSLQGWLLHALPAVRVLHDPRDQGSLARAGRPHARGVHPAHVRQVGPARHLRRRQARARGGEGGRARLSARPLPACVRCFCCCSRRCLPYVATSSMSLARLLAVSNHNTHIPKCARCVMISARVWSLR
jgi:SP family sugar:H+ symporter-like MFS transporter